MAMPLGRPDAHAAVLLIDAHDADRTELAMQLRREGYEVTEVAGGSAALAALARRPFDLIVTEPKLPGFAGAHAVTALREIAPDVPLVVYARAPTVEQAVQCMKQGASEYV